MAHGISMRARLKNKIHKYDKYDKTLCGSLPYVGDINQDSNWTFLKTLRCQKCIAILSLTTLDTKKTEG